MVHLACVTNIINRLERLGLVARRPNPGDGRVTLAEITAAGRDVAQRATAGPDGGGFRHERLRRGPARGDVRRATGGAGGRGGFRER